jgi:2-keto-3-deoxy-L-rhamnonate aldolase RhmA
MENRLRQLLNAGQPTLGTHMSCTWPTLWEVVGATGQFDYIEFGSQYGSWDLHDLDNMCRAAELTHTGTMIKIDRHPKDFLAQRAIGAGFQGILFADIMTVEEARECVRAVKLPPEGVNGFMGTRGIRPDDYVQHIDDIVIAIMVEKETLVDRLEEVLAIPGLDMIQFGPADYGLSLRRPGEPFVRADYADQIAADQRRAIEMALAAGVRPRVEAGSAEGIRAYVEQGIRDVCIGWDRSIIAAWCREEGGKVRDMFGRVGGSLSGE